VQEEADRLNRFIANVLDMTRIMTSSVPTIRFGLICDDIRKEDNGKFIAIGIYAGDIRISVLPFSLALVGLISFDIPAPIETNIEIIILLNEKQMAHATGEVSFKEAGIAMLSVPKMLVRFEEYGDLHYRIKIGDGDWTDIFNGPVRAP